MSLATLWTTTANRARCTTIEGTFSKAAAETSTDLASSFQCIIEPLSGRELESLGKTVGEVSHRMFCPTGTDIKARDIATDADGVIYRVMAPAMNPAGRSHHLVVLLLQQEES